MINFDDVTKENIEKHTLNGHKKNISKIKYT